MDVKCTSSDDMFLSGDCMYLARPAGRSEDAYLSVRSNNHVRRHAIHGIRIAGLTDPNNDPILHTNIGLESAQSEFLSNGM